MDASESPPHPCLHQPRGPPVPPYQQIDDIPNTSSCSLINHYLQKYNSKLTNLDQSGAHHSVRRVKSDDTLRLGVQQRVVDKERDNCDRISTARQQKQASIEITTHPLETSVPLLRFNFVRFWNPQRLFSAVRPSLTSQLQSFPGSSASPQASSLEMTDAMSVTSEGSTYTSTPTSPSALGSISMSSSSTSIRSLVTQEDLAHLNQKSHPAGLSTRPILATTTTSNSSQCSAPEPLLLSTLSDRKRHHFKCQECDTSQLQQISHSTSKRTGLSSIQKSSSDNSDLNTNIHKRCNGNTMNTQVNDLLPTSISSPLSNRTAVIDKVQKRIEQGQMQLAQYTNMIQKHNINRSECVTALATHQERREALESEIDVLEKAIRHGPSPPLSQLSTFFSVSNPLWSSPLSHSHDFYDESNSVYEDQGTCCPYKATLNRTGAGSAFSVVNTGSLLLSVTPSTILPNQPFVGAQPIHLGAISPFSGTSSLSHLTPTSTQSPNESQLLPLSQSFHPDSIEKLLPSSVSKSSIVSCLSNAQPQSMPCQPLLSIQSTLSPPLSSAPNRCTSTSSVTTTTTIPTPTPTTATSNLVVESTLVAPKKCQKCCLKSTLCEKRDQLRNVQQAIDQIQQKIYSFNSQIRHLQRTFILPIETCLSQDQEELNRTLLKQMQLQYSRGVLDIKN